MSVALSHGVVVCSDGVTYPVDEAHRYGVLAAAVAKAESLPPDVQESTAISRHEYAALFKAEVERLVALTCSKNANYANDGDALANFRLIEKMSDGAISTEVGILTRMSDKLQRVTNLICGASNNHESIDDNLDDLAVYSIILKVFLRRKAQCQKSTTAPAASSQPSTGSPTTTAASLFLSTSERGQV